MSEVEEKTIDQEVVNDLTSDLSGILGVDKPEANEETQKDETQDDTTTEEKSDDKADEQEQEETQESKEEEESTETLLDFNIEDIPDVTEEKQEQATDDKSHKALERMRKENAELKAQLANGNNEEVEKLKADLEEAHSIIGRVSLENHPKFREKHDTPVALLLENVKSALKQMDIDESVADTALNMNMVDRMNYLATEAPDIAHAIAPIYTQMDIHRTAKAKELEAYRESLENYDTQYQAQTQQQIATIKEQHFQGALTEILSEGDFIFRKSDNEERNKKVDSLLVSAKKIFNSDDPALQSKYLLQGIQAPIYKSLLVEQSKYIKSLEGELDKAGKARPRISSTTRKTDKSNKTPDKMTSSDVARRVSPFRK